MVPTKVALAPASVVAPTAMVSKAPALTTVEVGTRRWLIVAGVMLAALLQTVDATIVNVALPTIEGNLGASIDEATWIITAYVIANVVVIPMTPWFQLRFGRKQYFLASIAGFTIASVLCGFSTSLDELIFFRIVQGAFGGGLIATAQVILRETFPPNQLGLSQSIFALGTVLGPSIGPTLGGVITDNMSWPWIFDINVVPGAIAFGLLVVFQRAPNVGKNVRLDVAGVLLLVVSIGSLQYVLDQGQRVDWLDDDSIRFALGASAIAAVSFVVWEWRARAPIVDLRVLTRQPVFVAICLAMINAIAVFGLLLLLPQFTVGILGFTDTLAGVLIGLRALPIAFLSLIIGRLTNSPRVSLPALIGCGLAGTGLSAIWLSSVTTVNASVSSLGPPLVCMGFSIAFVYSPLLLSALRSVDVADSSKAASFVALGLQLGGSIAAAALVTLVDRRAQFHQAQIASGMTLHNVAIQSFLVGHSLTALSGLVDTQAAVLSYADAFLVVGCIALGASPLVVFLRKGTRAVPRPGAAGP